MIAIDATTRIAIIITPPGMATSFENFAMSSTTAGRGFSSRGTGLDFAAAAGVAIINGISAI